MRETARDREIEEDSASKGMGETSKDRERVKEQKNERVRERESKRVRETAREGVSVREGRKREKLERVRERATG